MLDRLPGGAFLSEPGHGTVHFNPRACAILGDRLDRLVGDGWRRLIHPDDRARVEAIANEANTVGAPFDALSFRIVRPDGDLRSIMVSIAYSDEDGRSYVGTIEDVTELAAVAETHAREAEAWRYVVDALPTGAYISRRGHGAEHVNAAACALFGAGEAELLGPGWRSFIHPDDREAVVGAIEEAYASGAPFPSLAFRIVRPDGNVRSVVLSVIGDRQRSISTGIIADITDAEAERAVTERETARWRSMLDALPIGVFQSDEAGPDYQSNGFRELFELDGTEADDSWTERIHPDDRDRVRETVARYRAEPAACAPFDFRIVRRDGSVRYLTTVYAAERSGAALTGLVLDVTDAIEAEAERFEVAEKMAEMTRLDALGVLAGGIAHDFNNLLMVILGYLDLAREELDAGSPAQPMLESMREAAARAEMLARAMLSYAGRRTVAKGAVDLSRLLRDTAALATARDSSAAIIDTSDVPDGLVVRGDETELGQVFLNLLVNATQAGTNGDRVRVGVAARTRADGADGADGADSGPTVEVTVTDDGVGIGEQLRSRVFEPFFTTKDNGTGLGLSIVHGVVVAHGGTIDVQSEEGRGTTFTVLLPAGSAAQDDRARRELPAIARRDLRALVVDDQEPVLRLTLTVLQQSGIDAVGMTAPAEAIAALTADPEGFDVVITDLTMPGVPGDELWRALDAIRPGIPTVVVSGHAAEDVVDRVGSSGTATFLHKPWSIAELHGAIARVVGGG